VGYVAYVALPRSGCLLYAWGQGRRAGQWSASPKKRRVFGLRCRSVRSIDLLTSCGSWLQMGSRQREMATGNASIVAVMGRKDNAGAGDSVRGDLPRAESKHPRKPGEERRSSPSLEGRG
jgi:hypothetical protein